jgi:hypothetical protein
MGCVLVPFLLAITAALPQGDPDPHRQFDFWVGEWSVQNRHLQADKTWRDGDVTRARIVPVCGGRAVLEEWAGTLHGSFMNGFSLRAYDPAREDWDLLLFWTTDGNGAFGRLRGTFRHGRGEFFSSWTNPGGTPVLQRYSFSDGLPSSVRWDSALSSDGGVTWKTDWIMEFSRTRPAAEVTQDRLFDVAWTEGTLSPHPGARQLDWLLGSWTGHQTDMASGDEREARLRSKLLDKDCLVLDLLETRESGAEDWDERLCVRGFLAQNGAFESWRVAERDTVLRSSRGSFQQGVVVFEGERLRETLVRVDDDQLVIEEEERPGDSAEFALRRVTKLRRAD